jgi:glycosyltransferase involved in cell wall biosynthesis
MKVSVVIPVFNRADTVEQAIRSVLAQTAPAHEIVAVDDGSSDGSPDVVAGLGDPRVRLVRQPNGGAGSARNRGLDEATGDWIAFLDADDWWTGARLESAASALASRPDVDFMHANRHEVHSDGRSNASLTETADRLRDPLVQLGGFTLKTSAVMIRRELIERHALRFPTDQSTCEDYHLFWRAIMFARAIEFTETPDVMIRIRMGSLMRGTADASLHRDNIKTMIEVLAWAKAHGAPPSRIDALSNQLHWQLRDQFLALMRTRSWSTLARYATLSLSHDGPVRSTRGLLSALRALRTPH